LYGQFAAVDDDHLSRVAFDVHVDMTRVIVLREFRFVGNRDGGDDRKRRRIEYRHILASAIKGKYVLALRLIQNGIRIVSRDLRFLKGLEAVEIEDRDRIRPAIAREAAVQIGRQGNAMHTLGIGNGAQHPT
jgi:hypothetical protein